MESSNDAKRDRKREKILFLKYILRECERINGRESKKEEEIECAH